MNHQEANIGAKNKVLYKCGAAWKGFVHPLPMEDQGTGPVCTRTIPLGLGVLPNCLDLLQRRGSLLI